MITNENGRLPPAPGRAIGSERQRSGRTGASRPPFPRDAVGPPRPYAPPATRSVSST